MNIDFKAIKESENISNEVLLNILEIVYSELNKKTSGFITFHEYVENPINVQGKNNTFEFELQNEPISASDMLIVTSKNNVLIPSNIIELDKNKVTVVSNLIKKSTSLFITYKS